MASMTELEKAIAIVEKAGGFVYMEDLDFETEEEIQRASAEAQEELNDYLDRKKQAFKKFDQALGSKNFNYGMAEDICYQNGIDMDDLEEWIHAQY